MTLKRMGNKGIVVDDLEQTIHFFCELVIEFDWRTTVHVNAYWHLNGAELTAASAPWPSGPPSRMCATQQSFGRKMPVPRWVTGKEGD
jgi:hypothetical protein